MAQRFQHQSRFRGVCRLIGGGRLRFNVTQPGNDREVDLVATFWRPPVVFGPLAARMTKRTVFIEHCSRAPSARDAYRYLAKLLRAFDGHLDRPAPTRGARPLLVVLCRSGIGAFGAFETRPFADLESIVTLGGLFHEHVFVVDAARLPHDAGFSGLRFMLRPDGKPSNYLAELLGDPTLPTLFKERVMEATMNRQIPASTAERGTAAQRLKRAARREGRLEGRVEGRVDELVAIAREVGGDEFAAAVAGMGDLAAMRQAVASAVRRG